MRLESARVFEPAGGAVVSKCGQYRYHLWRTVSGATGRLCAIGLNPSIADARIDDPTIRILQRIARDEGFGTLDVVNLNAFRSTDPRGMRAAKDPVGPDNDFWIDSIVDEADMVLCAWGAGGGDRGREVEARLRAREISLHVLALNADGSPHHPLRLSRDLRPRPWIL
jgi:hypothetical protein